MTTLMNGLMLGNGGVITIVGAGGKTSLMFRLAAELSQAGESVLTTTTTKIFIPDKEQSPKVVVSDSLSTILERYQAAKKINTHITAACRTGPQPDGQRRKLVGFEPEFIDKIHETGVFRWILVEADGAAGKPLKAPAEFEPVIPLSTTKLIGVLGLDGVGKPLHADWVFRPHQFSEVTGLAEGEIVTSADCVTSIIHKKGIFKGDCGRAERVVFLNKADQPGRRVVAGEIARLLHEKHPNCLQRVLIGQALLDPPVLEYLDLRLAEFPLKQELSRN